MAAHNIFPSSSTLRFREWQHLYFAARMEADREKLKDRVINAENAIFNRLQALGRERGPSSRRAGDRRCSERTPCAQETYVGLS